MQVMIKYSMKQHAEENLKIIGDTFMRMDESEVIMLQ
jgi:hypothetical protein